MTNHHAYCSGGLDDEPINSSSSYSGRMPSTGCVYRASKEEHGAGDNGSPGTCRGPGSTTTVYSSPLADSRCRANSVGHGSSNNSSLVPTTSPWPAQTSSAWQPAPSLAPSAQAATAIIDEDNGEDVPSSPMARRMDPVLVPTGHHSNGSAWQPVPALAPSAKAATAIRDEDHGEDVPSSPMAWRMDPVLVSPGHHLHGNTGHSVPIQQQQQDATQPKTSVSGNWGERHTEGHGGGGSRPPDANVSSSPSLTATQYPHGSLADDWWGGITEGHGGGGSRPPDLGTSPRSSTPTVATMEATVPAVVTPVATRPSWTLIAQCFSSPASNGLAQPFHRPFIPDFRLGN